MTRPVEHASGNRNGAFPAEWGRPEGSAGSDERAAWIRRNVEARVGVNPLRQLARRDAALLADLRRAELERKRDA